MIEKRMRVSMAVTLGMLFAMLAFGCGRLAPFYDYAGAAAADFAATIRQDLYPSKADEIPPVERTTPAEPSAPAANPPQERPATAEESAAVTSAAPAVEEPAEETPTPPDPQAVRDSAAAEVEALGPLHDELIGLLEAIQETKTDYWEKRWAGDRVIGAQIAKRNQIRDLRLYIEPEQPEWSVQSARRTAAKARVRLEYDIAVARDTLLKLREPTLGTLDRR